MHHLSKTLAVLCLLSALAVQSAPVSAGNAYIRPGADGVGQDAWLELNDADQFSLGLVDCKRNRRKFDLQLVLWVYGKTEAPAELESLRKTEADTPVALDFCINGICEENEFRAEARHGQCLGEGHLNRPQPGEDKVDARHAAQGEHEVRVSRRR